MITVYPVQPITVSTSALPVGAAQETAGNLQRTVYLLERILMELRAQNLLVSQLNQPQMDDVERLVNDARLLSQ